MRKRDYYDYVWDILNSIEEVEEFTSGMTLEDFSKDKKTINAVVRSLEVLGEAAKKIPQSIRKTHPDLPWNKMAGMRDKLIHQYFSVDLDILWKVVTEDLPPLKPNIKKILKELDEQTT